jgi:hypothetical protein
MSSALSVNELVDRARELDGQPVEVVGLLTFEFEDRSLGHFPKAERREITEAVDPPYYQSSVWLAFGTGSIRPNHDVLARWTGKRVRVVGVVRTPAGPGGCGHFGGWGCEVEVYTVERI